MIMFKVVNDKLPTIIFQESDTFDKSLVNPMWYKIAQGIGYHNIEW